MCDAKDLETTLFVMTWISLSASLIMCLGVCLSAWRAMPYPFRITVIVLSSLFAVTTLVLDIVYVSVCADNADTLTMWQGFGIVVVFFVVAAFATATQVAYDKGWDDARRERAKKRTSTSSSSSLKT